MQGIKASEFNENAPALVYSYRPSPVDPRGFLIVRDCKEKASFETVGDYTVLDDFEDKSISEKKVMNIVALLNGRKKLIELGHETKARILYRILPENDAEGRAQVMFYHLGSTGNSIENALFRMKGEKI